MQRSVCKIKKKIQEKNTHSIRIPNRSDTHQQNKIHVLGSHILSLKIVTKLPAISSCYLPMDFPPFTPASNVFLFNPNCECHNAYLSIFTSLDQETGFVMGGGGAGSGLRGGGFVRIAAGFTYVPYRSAKCCQQPSN
jgi:hypothetical protein